MTVSSTQSIVVYEGNGASTTFDFTFLIPSQADMVVTYTDTAGTETVLSTSQYSVTGIDDPNGGTVTYPLSGSPIANNTFLSIRRELPLTQTTDLVNQDGFYPQVVENALDTLCMQIQQISTLNSQAIRVPTSEDPPNTLPAASLRANQTFVFDSDGQPSVGSPSSAMVSSAMQPVVGASTLASARSLLGVGGPIVAATTNQSPTLADVSTNYMVTAAITVTLPLTTQTANGYYIVVHALTNDVTLTPDGADTIYGYSLGGSATVAAGTVATVVTDAAGNWWITTVIATDDFVGSIRPYAGLDAPSAKYQFCDGTSYLRATYPACFTAISMSLTVTKTSGSPVLGGFTSAQTAKLAAGMLVEGTGIPSGATILTTPSAGDTSITLNQNATNSLSQTATIIPFGAADSSHFYVPDTRGRALAGAELATNAANRITSSFFGAADRVGRSGGTQSETLSQAMLPVANFTVTDNRTWSTDDTMLKGTNAVGITGGASGFIGNNGSRGVTPSGAAPTAASGGSGLGHNNVQPTLVVNHLIRVLP